MKRRLLTLAAGASEVFLALHVLVLVGCSSHQQVAIVLTDSSSGLPIEAAFEINRVVGQQMWAVGPFGRTYESDFARSSMPGKLRYIPVGDRDVLKVHAPGYEATRLQVRGDRAYVVRGDSESLSQTALDRAWIDPSQAERYRVPSDGAFMIPVNPQPPRRAVGCAPP